MPIHSEASDNEKQSQKGGKLKNDKSFRSMTIEQIQDLIANTVKAQLGEVRIELTYTPILTSRGLMRSACFVVINLLNSTNLMEKAT